MSRLRLLPPYLFTDIDRARQAAIAAGKDVVNLGIGDPDRPTPPVLVETLAAAAADPANHNYPSNQGSAKLRRAIAEGLHKRHGLDVDPDSEVLVLIGSKEGLAHLPAALIDEGDEILVPDPGYPVYANASILCGAVPVPYTLAADAGFLPDPKALADLAGPRCRLLYLNSPHNPTGAALPAGFFGALDAALAGRDVVLANDAAYIELAFGAERPRSMLAEIDHRSRPVIEFHSLSKLFNMTGWRVAYAVGNAAVISALDKVKQNTDSGVFGAIQDVAAFALGEAYDALVDEVMAVYPDRRRRVCDALGVAGIQVFPTTDTFYVWAKVPGDGDSLGFCSRVLEELSVVVTPGRGFGPGGEGWFRISLTAPDERINEACERFRRL